MMAYGRRRLCESFGVATDATATSSRGPDQPHDSQSHSGRQCHNIRGSSKHRRRHRRDRQRRAIQFSPGIAVDSVGTVYVAEGVSRIRTITPAGVVTTLAAGLGNGSNDGTGSATQFDNPRGLAVDNSTGNVYMADQNNHTIRKITPSGVVTTFAGLAGNTGSTDGTGSAARFNLLEAWRSTLRALCMSPIPTTTRSGRSPQPAR